MISVNELVKDFGPIRAVDRISFEVQRGTVLGFLGPNGAGKSTTIRILAGFVRPTSGSAAVTGIDVLARPIEARRQVGYMPENTPLYGEMTVEEFLLFIAEMRGYRGKQGRQRARDAMERCFLENVRRQPIETLSKGYRQRTCMAQAILHDPPVLLLDEPTEGLDPNQKQVVREMIHAMARDKAIMLSTHVLEEVEAVCSRVIIINNGRIVADQDPHALKRRSHSYQRVRLHLAAPENEAREAFKNLPGAARVTLEPVNGNVCLHLTPRDKQPLVMEALDCARQHGWQVQAVSVDEGRLDEVFRELTSTEDSSIPAAGKSQE